MTLDLTSAVRLGRVPDTTGIGMPLTPDDYLCGVSVFELQALLSLPGCREIRIFHGEPVPVIEGATSIPRVLRKGGAQ